MNRQQKALVIEELQKDFGHNQAAFVVGVQGLTVKQLQALRRELRQQGGSFKIAKARLVKKAATDLSAFDEMSAYLKDQIGVAFAAHDASAVAKVLHTFSKDNALLRLVAGYYDNTVLDANAVARIASLPSKEVLLAQLCGTLQAPVANYVSILRQLLLRLMWVLQRIQEAKAASAAA